MSSLKVHFSAREKVNVQRVPGSKWLVGKAG